MKRKKNPQPDQSKTIDPALLEEILGGVPASGDGSGTVVQQDRFGSFFHS